MQVNAINSLNFTGRKSDKYQSKKPIENISGRKSYEDYRNSVSNRSMRNGAKAMIVGLLMAPATSVMTGCDAEAEAEAWSYAKDSVVVNCDCKPHIIHDKDTVWVHDTIPVIIDNHDTVYIKDKYTSPVIDTINSIMDDLDIDHGKGYIPLTISFIDEMDTKYRKHVFDGRSSSKDIVYYDAKKSPWSDDEGRFIIGTPLDESEKYMCSLTGDGKLYVMKMIPKNGITEPKSLSDYMYSSQSYIYDKDQAQKLLNKFVEYNNNRERIFDGTIQKGDVPNSLMITNPYGTSWRWTNIDVKSADAQE